MKYVWSIEQCHQHWLSVTTRVSFTARRVRVCIAWSTLL